LNLFDRAIDPRSIYLPAVAVNCEAGFPIVESAENYVCPAENAKAKLIDDITVECTNIYLRINRPRSSSSDFGFWLSVVRLAVENRPRQIRVFHAIQVRNKDIANAEQRKVLYQFVSQCAGTDYKYVSATKPILIPPADEAKAVKPIVFPTNFFSGNV
jgi:hypothetical protein